MIKKLTPSKIFNKKKREISCCDSFLTQQRKQQKIIDFIPKIYPSKPFNQPYKSPRKQQQNITILHFYPQTPKISQFQTRSNSINKPNQYIIPPTPLNPPTPKVQTLKNNFPKLNPLQRLKLRYSSSTSSQSHNQSQSQNKNDRITFNYQSPYTTLTQQSPKMISNKETFQLLKIQQNLQQQIQEFQWQYKLLLLQFQRLKKQKSSNKQHFQTLLLQIHNKQQQILQLQSLRKEQLRFLKQQLQLFIEEHQQ